MAMTEALAEAYASSPVDEIAYDTIELLHPAFRDEFDNPISVRVVRAFEPITAGLENTAPLNPGEMVEFKACPFNLTHPGFEENQVPSMQLSIANVSREITGQLELAIAQRSPITVIYRPYLDSDMSEPQIQPVITMTLTNAEAGLMQVTGTATLSDVHNWPFPSLKYMPDTFPGLVRT